MNNRYAKIDRERRKSKVLNVNRSFKSRRELKFSFENFRI